MRFFPALIQRALQLPAPGGDPVLFWRQRILEAMLNAAMVLGLLAYLPSVWLSLRVELWSVALVDTLAFAWVVAAALAPRWGYAMRVWGLLGVLYLIALVLLVRLGTAGAGMLWLTATPILAAILLGLRAAIGSWLLALVTLAGCGWGLSLGLLGGASPSSAPSVTLATWGVLSANALFLSAAIALPVGILLRGLEHANRALSREEERFTKVFELSPEPIAISRVQDGALVAVNQAWSTTFGWTGPEALGKTVAELGFWLPGQQAKLHAELLRTGAVAPLTLALRARDGTEVPVLLSAKLLDLEGEACLLAMAQDLTASLEAERERARLAMELQHAQKLESLGSLAGGVAHDMNNILAGILGMGSVLRVKHAGDPELVKALELILGAGERGRKLVRGLTDFARKGLEDARPVDFNQLIHQELELLRSTTLQKIELVQDLAPDLPMVLGEPAALHNVLMNLCVNAIDAMPDGGTLGFATRVLASGEVQVTLFDTGQGMTEAVRARAMEPFYTTKPLGKGTGLGLAGVYGTMKAHGGAVTIQSKVGRGTRILLRFPAHAAPAVAVPAAPEAGPESQARALRILVVDDDPIIHATVPAMFECLGHSVAVASRGQEALERLRAGLAVDLVMLDHNMPGLSGAETLRQLKAFQSDLPVILATGFLEPSVEALAGQFSGVWLLTKPFTLPGLREKLKAIDGGVNAYS